MTSWLDDLVACTTDAAPGRVTGAPADAARPTGPTGPTGPTRGTEPGGLPLRGQGLRYFLSLELREAGELTIAELVGRIEAAGYQIVGRASKTVSDALRWEIDHGRVRRVARGRYQTVRIPRSTVWWMRRTLEGLQGDWDEAVRRGGDLTLWLVPAARPPRPAHAPPTGLMRYRRQQRTRRPWETPPWILPTSPDLPSLVA